MSDSDTDDATVVWMTIVILPSIYLDGVTVMRKMTVMMIVMIVTGC